MVTGCQYLHRYRINHAIASATIRGVWVLIVDAGIGPQDQLVRVTPARAPARGPRLPLWRSAGPPRWRCRSRGKCSADAVQERRITHLLGLRDHSMPCKRRDAALRSIQFLY